MPEHEQQDATAVLLARIADTLDRLDARAERAERVGAHAAEQVEQLAAEARPLLDAIAQLRPLRKALDRR